MTVGDSCPLIMDTLEVVGVFAEVLKNTYL